jgi:hypothetical protein
MCPVIKNSIEFFDKIPEIKSNDWWEWVDEGKIVIGKIYGDNT